MKSRPTPAAEPPAKPALGAGLRRFLYITAGITGGAIMIIEILGAKILSPYVGTSHFVWTAQIAVTMIALACGYYAGGRLVDRSSRLGRLYGAILIAAAALTVSVALRERIVYWFLPLPLPAGSLLSSVFLFFIPLLLLAMTGPFVVRVLTGSVADVGGNMGRLTAVSTLGSFLGTVAIGYLLIPLLPNSVTMYATAALLAVVALVYMATWGRKARGTAAAAVVAAACLAAGYAGLRTEGARLSSMEELRRVNSNFGLLQVLQSRGTPYRVFLNDYLIQNTYDSSQGRSMSMFTYMLEGLARAYTPRLEKVLCIGMGVGIVPRDLAREGVAVDVVEINPAVVPLAEEYFGMDRSAFRLSLEDGRFFINRSAELYDAVILDAFLGDSSPTHLMSREAFTAIRRILKPDGVLVMNTFVDFQATKDFMAASLYRTLETVFPSVRVHGTRNANSLFVASPRPDLALLHTPEYGDVHPAALQEVRDAFGRQWQPDPLAGMVLTDDYNPAEYYDAANREKMRRMLALSMKNQ